MSEELIDMIAKRVGEVNDAESPASPAGVVKPLEWKRYEDAQGYVSNDATTMIGRYSVWTLGPGHEWFANMLTPTSIPFQSDEAAKSAAFADYSARIMSAIEPACVGVETREQRLEDALRNLLGVYDTPLSRRRFPQDDFMKEAIDTARASLKGGEQ